MLLGKKKGWFCGQGTRFKLSPRSCWQNLLANSPSHLGFNLIENLGACMPCSADGPPKLQPRAPGESRGQKGTLAGEPWMAPRDVLIWLSPRSILALLLSSSVWWRVEVAAACLSHQLGLLPSPSVCPAIAGVKHAWLSLELASLSETAFFFETTGLGCSWKT